MLSVVNVSRSLGGRQVLDGVTFDVRPGRMTGFIGANGAGKTTTMRIILGVLAAHGGQVTWQGAPLTQQVRQRFGYMPEERGLYPKMRAAEQVAWLGRLHGLSQQAASRNTDDLFERLGLTERANDKLEELSLGNQQRVQVAAALVHDPILLVLDEPFSSLDPLAVEVVVAVLRERTAAGVPVLFSSHQLGLVERLCDDVVIISAGSVVASGEREELRARYGTSRFELVVDDVSWAPDVAGVRVVERDGSRVVLEPMPGHTDGQVDQEVLKSALRRGAVRRFTPVVPSLDEIFKETIG